MRARCAVVAIGVKSAKAPAVTSCEGDGESQASENKDSEQMCGILGVDVVWDCGETSAGVGPLLGGMLQYVFTFLLPMSMHRM